MVAVLLSSNLLHERFGYKYDNWVNISSAEIVLLLFWWDKSTDVAGLLFPMIHLFLASIANYRRSLMGTLDNQHKELNDFFSQQTWWLARNTKCWITFLTLSLYWNKSVDIYVGDTKDKVSKTAGTLAWIKAVALNCTNSLYIIHRTFKTTTSTQFHLGISLVTSF